MNHSLLLHLSWHYERDESRADVYPMVRYWIENNDSELEKIRGIATLLYIWNAGYYSRAGKGFSGAVDHVREVFSKTTFHMLYNNVTNLELSNVNLNNYKKDILELYTCIIRCRGLGPTGTSKILHLLNPNCFVMWDNNICSYFHDKHKNRGMWHREGYEICYFEFLKDMQREVMDVLNHSSKKEIERGLFEMSGYKKTIAKSLDEFNYMVHTVPEKKHNKRKRMHKKHINKIARTI